MKSNKGIAMTSLVIYVTCFFVITTLVGVISTYFYNNMDLVSTRAGGSAEFNKLNVYLLDKIKDPELHSVYATKTSEGGPHDGMVVFFDELGNKKDLIVKNGDLIYLNDVVLATNVVITKKQVTYITKLVIAIPLFDFIKFSFFV